MLLLFVLRWWPYLVRYWIGTPIFGAHLETAGKICIDLCCWFRDYVPRLAQYGIIDSSELEEKSGRWPELVQFIIYLP